MICQPNNQFWSCYDNVRTQNANVTVVSILQDLTLIVVLSFIGCADDGVWWVLPATFCETCVTSIKLLVRGRQFLLEPDILCTTNWVGLSSIIGKMVYIEYATSCLVLECMPKFDCIYCCVLYNYSSDWLRIGSVLIGHYWSLWGLISVDYWSD